MNYILLKLNSAPCIISADDRLAYFGAWMPSTRKADSPPSSTSAASRP